MTGATRVPCGSGRSGREGATAAPHSISLPSTPPPSPPSYPDVKRHCAQHEDPYDGAFWMTFDDFVEHFDRVEVCDRSSHRDLRLDVREDEGLMGVCKGCAVGCATYWCLCNGLRTIYCGHRTSTDVEYSAPLCSCTQDHGRGWKDNSVV